MNIAIIGCGHQGTKHAQVATSLGMTVLACGDTVAARARKLATHSHASFDTRCDTLIRRKDVELVIIATPTSTHLDYIRIAAKAGKNVLCESPATLNATELREAFDCAHKHRVNLYTTHTASYTMPRHALQEECASDPQRKPGFVTLHRAAPIPQERWRREAGVIQELLTHELEWIQDTFGKVERVFFHTTSRAKIEDYALATVTLRDGTIVQLIGSWAHPMEESLKVEVCSPAGIIQYDSEDLVIKTHLYKPAKSASSTEGLDDLHVTWKQLLSGTPSRANIAKIIRSRRVTDAAVESAQIGRAVRV